MQSRDMFKNFTILYLLRCSDNLLGAQKHLLYLVEHFAGRFKRVIVGTNKVPYVDEFEKRGAKWHEVPAARTVEAFKAMYHLGRIMSSESVDIVHSHHRYMTSLAYWVSQFYPIKLVHTAHNVFHDKKLFSFLGHNIIAVSDGVKENLVDFFGIRETEIEVIYNGIAPLEVNEAKLDALKADLSTGEDFVRIACIARLEQAKGHTYLLQAMAKVLREERKTKVFLVGDGSLKNMLISQANELGISNAVVFLGFRKDIPEILACSDFVVLPSIQEGLPLVLLESLSLARPVIATDVGGVKEVVVDKRTGLLVKRANERELAQAISYFIRNPNARERMGKIGKVYVKERFSLGSMLSKTEKVYTELLSG